MKFKESIRVCICFSLVISFTIIGCAKIDSTPEPVNKQNPFAVNSPNSIVIDNGSNVYFTNYGDVIKIASSGVESVIVDTNAWPGCGGEGGYSISASIREPFGICVDSVGEIFFADIICSKVYKISVGGIITTCAGNGSIGFSGDGGVATNAELHYPVDLTVDKHGNIYIVDGGNSRIRMINGSNNIISTIAGNGTVGYTGDSGPAINAELSNPKGVKIDDSGNIYIADCGNNVIRKINIKGIINTVAGNGQSVYNGDSLPALSVAISVSGIALDLQQDIFFSDFKNNRIRKLNMTNGIITTVAGNGVAGYSSDGVQATASEISFPQGLILDKSDNIYFCDYGNDRIRKITTSTGIISSIAHN